MARPELRGTHGMVTSSHWLASAAGMAVLERGGNAFDAAVAAGFALEVVEPQQLGPAGDVVALVHVAGDDAPLVLCGQGPAPAAATIERFGELGLDAVPETGLLAACVPGLFGSWLLLLRDLGTWELADVLSFARSYAEGGLPVLPGLVRQLREVEPLFRQAWPSSAAVWLPDGPPPAPGAVVRNPALAETYRRLLAEAAGGACREARIERARRAWYEGFVAEAIDEWCRTAEPLDASGRRHAGLLRGQDLAAWCPRLEPAVGQGYHRWRVWKAGQWSQGPVLAQTLALLEGLGLDGLGPRDPALVHLAVESAKLAYADRQAWYGDPDVVPDVTAELLAPGYTAERRRLIGDAASRELRPGAPRGRRPPAPDAATPVRPRPESPIARLGTRQGDTCHLDVVDRWGNVVSATPSGGWLQGSPAVPGLGFALGTRACQFDLDPGSPNALAPGKRPRTTLSPSIAVRDDGFEVAFGTSGGDYQEQWALAFFLALAHGIEDLQLAIDAPVFQTGHFVSAYEGHRFHPASLLIEDRAEPAALEDLRRRGHRVRTTSSWSLGRVLAAARSPASGLLLAAANPRERKSYAAGR